MATQPAAAATQPVVSDAAAAVLAKPVPRPTTCGSWAKLHPADAETEGRSVTCKRLPRHKGECRSHLTVSAEHKAAAPKTAKSPAKSARRVKRVTREALLAAAAKLASGEITPSAYMSLVSRFGQYRARKALAVDTAEVVAETVAS